MKAISCFGRLAGASALRLGRALAVGALLSGCGGDRAMQQRLDALRDQITKMQSEQDRLEERLAAIEMQRVSALPRGTALADASGVQRPRLKVIKLTPESESALGADPGEEPLESADAGPEDGPRPVLRSRGSQVEADMPGGSAGSGQNSPQSEPRKK
jgi:hypothetical protein